MDFKCRKDRSFIWLISGMILFLFFCIFEMFRNIGKDSITVYVLLISFLTLSYFVISLLTITYTLESKSFKYRMGFFKNAIDTNSIYEIVNGRSLYSGIKIASAKNGLIIKYNKFDEIYISPENNETFITEILKENKHILISTKY